MPEKGLVRVSDIESIYLKYDPSNANTCWKVTKAICSSLKNVTGSGLGNLEYRSYYGICRS